MSDNPIPTGLTANRQTREVTITWADGHTSVYPFGLLRAGCPCASCRGGHEYMKAEPDEAVFSANLPESPQTRMNKVEAVGSYAITIEWEDGHHFGIYNWHYLRKLCPCSECRGQEQKRRGWQSSRGAFLRKQITGQSTTAPHRGAGGCVQSNLPWSSS